MLAIRVDGNSEIGTGHVQRCLSIAEALKSRGEPPFFILSDNNMAELIMNKGFKFVSLNTLWYDMESEISKLFEIISKYKVNTIILDSYYISDNYTHLVGVVVDLYYIDDFYNKHYRNLKGLISYNVSCDFSKEIYESNTNLLLGTKYIPLRSEFQNITPITITEDIKNIMLTTGGTDKYLITEKIIEILKNEENFKDVVLHVVIGNFFTNKENLRKLSESNDKIILYENVEKMSDIMLRSDVAISAGGTTLYELCVCGLPTITFTIAENQVKMTEAFYKSRTVLYSGHCAGETRSISKKILSNLTILKSKTLRQKMHDKAVTVIDGLGAKRIADKFIIQSLEKS